ncbi:MAG: hypothetical protein ACFB0D_00840 [Phormidesmis sp.]
MKAQQFLALIIVTNITVTIPDINVTIYQCGENLLIFVKNVQVRKLEASGFISGLAATGAFLL